MTADTAAPSLKGCPFCGSSGDTLVRGFRYPEGSSQKESAIWCPTCDCKGPEKAWNTRATPTPTEARERIARIVFFASEDGLKYNTPSNSIFWGAWKDEPAAAECWKAADAIIALLPDAATIRADWHTTGWDRARNSGRTLLVWREFAGISEHVELGWYSDSKSAWVNTYGRPFHGDPDGWAPLLPFKTKSAIRAAAFEEAAKIAEDDERQDEWPKSVDVTRTSPSRIMQQTIAAALRNAGRTG